MGRRRSRWIWEMGIEDGEYKKAAPSAGERVYHNILDWIGLIFARQCSRVVTLTAVCTITIGLIWFPTEGGKKTISHHPTVTVVVCLNRWNFVDLPSPRTAFASFPIGPRLATISQIRHRILPLHGGINRCFEGRIRPELSGAFEHFIQSTDSNARRAASLPSAGFNHRSPPPRSFILLQTYSTHSFPLIRHYFSFLFYPVCPSTQL